MKAKIIEKTLTDGSRVYDIEIPASDGVITISVDSRFPALDLQRLIQENAVAAKFE